MLFAHDTMNILNDHVEDTMDPNDITEQKSKPQSSGDLLNTSVKKQVNFNDPDIILPASQGKGLAKTGMIASGEKTIPVIMRSFSRDVDKAKQKEKNAEEAARLSKEIKNSKEADKEKDQKKTPIPQKKENITVPPVPIKKVESGKKVEKKDIPKKELVFTKPPEKMHLSFKGKPKKQKEEKKRSTDAQAVAPKKEEEKRSDIIEVKKRSVVSDLHEKKETKKIIPKAPYPPYKKDVTQDTVLLSQKKSDDKSFAVLKKIEKKEKTDKEKDLVFPKPPKPPKPKITAVRPKEAERKTQEQKNTLSDIAVSEKKEKETELLKIATGKESAKKGNVYIQGDSKKIVATQDVFDKAMYGGESGEGAKENNVQNIKDDKDQKKEEVKDDAGDKIDLKKEAVRNDLQQTIEKIIKNEEPKKVKEEVKKEESPSNIPKFNDIEVKKKKKKGGEAKEDIVIKKAIEKEIEPPEPPKPLIHISAEQLDTLKTDVVRIESEIKTFNAQQESISTKKRRVSGEKKEFEDQKTEAKRRLEKLTEKESVIAKNIKEIEIKESGAETSDKRHDIEQKRWAQEDKRATVEKEKWEVGEMYEKTELSIKEKDEALSRAEASLQEIVRRIEILTEEKKEKKFKIHLGEIETKKQEVEDIQVVLLEEKRRLDYLRSILEEEEKDLIKEKQEKEKRVEAAEALSERRVFEESRQEIEKRQRVAEQKRWEAEKMLGKVQEKICMSNEHYDTLLKVETEVRDKLS